MLPFRSRGLWLTLGFAFLAVSSAIVAYYRIFTGFAEWDDEGTQMMPIRQFLDGGTLYENIRTGYGPVYYFFNWLLRKLTFTGVSNDVTRATSMVVWALCAIACAWIVWKLGRSLTAALVTHFLVFRMLSFFCNEPGHPQELCMMLLIGLVASGLAAESLRFRPIFLVAAGVFPAALLLVKVNIGAFAILAVALAMLYHVTVARYLFGGLALLLPVILMRGHFVDPQEIGYAVAIMGGTAALVVAPIPRIRLFSFRDCAIAAGAFLCTCLIVLAILFFQGVAPGTLLTSLVLNHLHMSVLQGNWYLPMGLNPLWILWGVAGPATALLASRRRWMPPAVALAAFSGVAVLLAVLGSAQLIGLVTPFCWVVACTRPSFARTLLACLATLQTLYAYPIAGSQTPFTSISLILVAGVCMADVFQSLPLYVRDGILARAAATAVVLGVLLSYPVQALRARHVYQAAAPLHLPGAERIHLESREATTFHWLVSELKKNCDTFVAYPGLPSLNFWTGLPMPGPVKEPPGPLNSGQWMDLLSPAQQQSVVDEFIHHPNGCVVYHPSGVQFWNKGGIDQRSLPLVNYVQNHFKTVASMGDYQFQVRNDRTWNQAPSTELQSPPVGR